VAVTSGSSDTIRNLVAITEFIRTMEGILGEARSSELLAALRTAREAVYQADLKTKKSPHHEDL
jgi:hypothetical protein